MSVKTILVATDSSSRSDRAVRRATLLAKELGASLSLVHVVDDDQPGRIVDAEREAAAAVLHDQARSLREIDGVDCEPGYSWAIRSRESPRRPTKPTPIW